MTKSQIYKEIRQGDKRLKQLIREINSEMNFSACKSKYEEIYSLAGRVSDLRKSLIK